MMLLVKGELAAGYTSMLILGIGLAVLTVGALNRYGGLFYSVREGVHS